MARPKLKEIDKKTKLGISISKDLKNKIEAITNNKSQFIEELIQVYFDSKL